MSATLRAAITKFCTTSDRGPVIDAVLALLDQRPVTVAELILESDFKTERRWIRYEKQPARPGCELWCGPRQLSAARGAILVRDRWSVASNPHVDAWGKWQIWAPNIEDLAAHGVLVDRVMP